VEYMTWFWFLILCALNVLDWSTTYVFLMWCRSQGPDYGPMPIWKRTRPGKWLVRHGLAKQPEMRMAEWWEHELNPWVARGMKRWGLGFLLPMKVGALSLTAFALYLSGGSDSIAHILAGLCILMTWVVTHNWELINCKVPSVRTAKKD
jgi:hypothetical protein